MTDEVQTSPPPIQQPKLIAVDPTLSHIIATVESSGFSGAMRFEPGVYREAIRAGLVMDIQLAHDTDPALRAAVEAHAASIPADKVFDLIKTIAKINGCTLETAQVLYATSFGLYQVMGYNLYSLGLHRPISEFLAGPHARILQDAMFAKFLSGKGILYTWRELASDQDKLNLFATKYNGSLSYGNRMRAVARTLTVETQQPA